MGYGSAGVYSPVEVIMQEDLPGNDKETLVNSITGRTPGQVYFGASSVRESGIKLA